MPHVSRIQFCASRDISKRAPFDELLAILNNVDGDDAWSMTLWTATTGCWGKIEFVRAHDGVKADFSLFRDSQALIKQTDLLIAQPGRPYIGQREFIKMSLDVYGLEAPSPRIQRRAYVMMELVGPTVCPQTISNVGNALVSAGFCSEYSAFMVYRPKQPSITFTATRNITGETMDQLVEECKRSTGFGDWMRAPVKSFLSVIRNLTHGDNHGFSSKHGFRLTIRRSDGWNVDIRVAEESDRILIAANERVLVHLSGGPWPFLAMEKLADQFTSVLGAKDCQLWDVPFGTRPREVVTAAAAAVEAVAAEEEQQQQQEDVEFTSESEFEQEYIVGPDDVPAVGAVLDLEEPEPMSIQEPAPSESEEEPVESEHESADVADDNKSTRYPDQESSSSFSEDDELAPSLAEIGRLHAQLDPMNQMIRLADAQRMIDEAVQRRMAEMTAAAKNDDSGDDDDEEQAKKQPSTPGRKAKLARARSNAKPVRSRRLAAKARERDRLTNKRK